MFDLSIVWTTGLAPPLVDQLDSPELARLPYQRVAFVWGFYITVTTVVLIGFHRESQGLIVVSWCFHLLSLPTSRVGQRCQLPSWRKILLVWFEPSNKAPKHRWFSCGSLGLTSWWPRCAACESMICKNSSLVRSFRVSTPYPKKNGRQRYTKANDLLIWLIWCFWFVKKCLGSRFLLRCLNELVRFNTAYSWFFFVGF